MNSEPLWSDERIRLIAFDIATQYLADKSAGKATPMTQLIEAKMIELRDYYEAQLANQYQRIEGFVELVDQLEAQLAQRDAIPPDVREAIITLCEVNEYHWAARHLHKWLDQQEDRP